MRSTSVLLAVAALLMTSDLHAAGQQADGLATTSHQIRTSPATEFVDWRSAEHPGSHSHDGDHADHASEPDHPSDAEYYEECCDECCDECCEQCGADECCADECGGGRSRRRNQADNFNCGCNGSYKFPVPPLYTYHWPGMYSHQLMTDYHSPWRFPAIRPYRDEKPIQATEKPSEMRQASHVSSSLASPAATVTGEPEPISAKMRRYYRQ